MKEKIGQLILVDGFLTEYIRIHDDMLKRSLRKVIPIPGLFKAVDYGSHIERLESLADKPQRILISLADDNDDVTIAFR